MPNKLLPRVIEVQATERTAQLVLQVESDIAYFEGHFEQWAVLPGVALISWVVRFSAKHLNTSEEAFGLDNVKFLKPITPGLRIHLWIEAFTDKLEFVCTTGNSSDKIASGRIQLRTA